jgi:hypothetical protein
MLKKVAWMAAALTLVTAPSVFAQDARAEVGFNIGWSFQDGVDGQAVRALDGNTYDRIDPKDSFKWGFNAGALIGPNAEVGFMFMQAPTTLEASGTATREIGDMTINNYHGYFGYNFFDSDVMARPYIFAGFGATHFGAVNYTRINNETGTIGGETQFSTTWGAGVKVFTGPNFGVKVGAQWTPVYIKSDSAGWWCDPWWGCYVVGDAKYANQFDFTGGVTFRF